MAPIRGTDKQEKAERPGKHASGPTGYKEVGCGTVIDMNKKRRAYKRCAMHGCRKAEK